MAGELLEQPRAPGSPRGLWRVSVVKAAFACAGLGPRRGFGGCAHTQMLTPR